MRDIAEGEPVRRYNQIIGFASATIAAGEHVHVHNLAMGDFEPRLRLRRRREADEFVAAAGDLPWASCAPTAASPRATTSAS